MKKKSIKHNSTISDRKKRIAGENPAFEAVIETAQDYYPFGMLMPGRKYNPAEYRFGFNGQEKDDEITGVTGSHVSFEYRMHDTRLGRFLSIDPLCASYPWNSPYAFAENRVIDDVDLEGLECQNPMMYRNWTPEQSLVELKAVVNMASNVSSNFIKPFVIVGSGVITPIVGNIVYGVSGEYPEWATPFTVDNWDFQAKPEWLDAVPWDNGGKDVLKSTISVILTGAPLIQSENVIDKYIQSTIIKIPIKQTINVGIDLIGNSYESSMSSITNSTSTVNKEKETSASSDSEVSEKAILEKPIILEKEVKNDY